jgi:hypothetical protein
MFTATVTMCMIGLMNCQEVKSGPHTLALCEDRIAQIMAKLDELHHPETLVGECLEKKAPGDGV